MQIKNEYNARWRGLQREEIQRVGAVLDQPHQVRDELLPQRQDPRRSHALVFFLQFVHRHNTRECIAEWGINIEVLKHHVRKIYL